MRYFDYTFLKDGNIPAKLVNILSSIFADSKMLELEQEEYPDAFLELREDAIVNSVEASNAIEGIRTTDERVAPVVRGVLSPMTHDEKEMIGYRDALNLVHSRYQKLDFRIEDILQLHLIMMTPSGDENRGKFKTHDNMITETLESGERRIRFIPVSAAETEISMKQLQLAYMDARNDAEINNLLLIPCIILDFLCIHPFADGNGRISRLLSLLLLYKAGFGIVKYISFEKVVQEHRQRYYEALRKSSIEWGEQKNDYIPFITDFLIVLLQCYQDCRMLASKMQRKRIWKRGIVEKALSTGNCSVSQIAEKFPDVELETVQAIIEEIFRETEN